MVKLKKIKLGFIGAGTMGNIFIRRLLKGNVVSKSQIFINDKLLERCRVLTSLYNVRAINNQQELVRKSDVLVLAIKPQDFKDLAKDKDIRKGFKNNKGILIISIMAGVNIKTIQRLLHHGAVIRAMPNIPSQIGEGVTIWKASAEVNQGDKKRVEIIFQSLGQTIEVNREKYIDMATAVSGSGPAYVFLFQELFIKAAKDLGLPISLAKRLVLETIQGAVNLQKKFQDNPEVLRERVTSKGGTTEQALRVFEDKQLAKIFQLAVQAAFNKSQELKKIIR